MSRHGPDKKKTTKEESTVLFLIDRLKSLTGSQEVLKTEACLFRLKCTIEDHSCPHIVDVCLENDIVDVLLDILDKGISPQDNNEIGLVPLVTCIVSLLSSTEPSFPVDVMLARTLHPRFNARRLLSSLISLFNTPNRLFAFSSKFYSSFGRLCRNGVFLNQPVRKTNMDAKIWKDLLFYESRIKVCCGMSCPPYLYECYLMTEVSDTSPPTAVKSKMVKKMKTVHIAKRLVEEELAWPAPRRDDRILSLVFRNVKDLIHPKNDRISLFTSLNADDPNVTETDVSMLSMIGGPYFWGEVGDESCPLARVVADELLEAAPTLKPVSEVTVGAMVAVVETTATAERNNNDDDNMCVSRARVVEYIDGDKPAQVLVFMVDHGVLRRVNVENIYQISGSSVHHLLTIEPQAKLCCLQGVQAPAVSTSWLEFALVTLTNIMKMSPDTGVVYVDARGMEPLPNLLQCGSLNVRLQTTRLLCNLASIPKVATVINWEPYINILLSHVVEVSHLMGGGVREVREVDTKLKSWAAVTLFLISNILNQKPEQLRLFLELQGHMVLLNLLRVSRNNPAVYQAAITALKPLYPHVRGINRSTIESVFSMEEELGDRPRSDERGACQKCDDSSNNNDEDDDESSDRDGDKKIKKDESIRHDQDDPSLPLEKKQTGEDGVDDETTAVGCIPVDGGAWKNVKEHFYVQDTYVPFQNDQTHQMMEEDSVSDISLDAILKTVCGMINSSGGTIYLGMSPQGKVQGLLMNRGDRDSMRLAMDQLMHQVVPNIPFNRLHVTYVPVVKPKNSVARGGGGVSHGCRGGRTFERFYDRMVVEIEVKCPEEILFHMMDGEVWQRSGCATYTITEQDVRCQLVEMESRKFHSQVLQLQHTVQTLTQSLHMP